MSEPASPRPKRKRFRRRTPPGASPGTITADPAAPSPVLSVIAFGPGEVHDERITDLAAVRALRAQRERFPVVWLDVAGLGDAAVIAQVGEVFGLHVLALEDVVNVHQRAKVEAYGDHLFLVARMVELAGSVETEQLSLFLGTGFVVTFQEQPGDCFGPVRDRIRSGRGALRRSGSDYLAYALLDATIDHYFPVLEAFGERLEALEDEIVRAPRPDSLQRVHAVKRDLLSLRRALWPEREALLPLLREEHPLIRPETRPYLADCYDHTIQLMDLLETYRELASSLTDIHLSSMANRLNEVMKVLTVFTAIFIPLTFVAGVYGMNFVNMPEIDWRYGYPATLGVMAAIALGLVLWFRRKGWIGRSRGGSDGARR